MRRCERRRSSQVKRRQRWVFLTIYFVARSHFVPLCQARIAEKRREMKEQKEREAEAERLRLEEERRLEEEQRRKEEEEMKQVV